MSWKCCDFWFCCCTVW